MTLRLSLTLSSLLCLHVRLHTSLILPSQSSQLTNTTTNPLRPTDMYIRMQRYIALLLLLGTMLQNDENEDMEAITFDVEDDNLEENDDDKMPQMVLLLMALDATQQWLHSFQKLVPKIGRFSTSHCLEYLDVFATKEFQEALSITQLLVCGRSFILPTITRFCYIDRVWSSFHLAFS